MVPFLKLRATCRVSFTVTSAEILSYERAIAVREVATIYLFGSVVERMATEVLGARVTLSTAFVGAFELAIGEDFATTSPSLGGLTINLHLFHAMSTEIGLRMPNIQKREWKGVGKSLSANSGQSLGKCGDVRWGVAEIVW
jgi:hypothetical protein